MTTKPKISVVATTRNDNHGGDLTRRMQIFTNSWIEQCQRHNLQCELILVEWNPPSDRCPLLEELSWPDSCSPCEVRIVTVPRELHQRLAHHDKLPLFQMIAKNVGIQRARADFILATNVDLLFSNELCQFLASDSLEKGRLYRIDRHDTDRGVPLEAKLDERLNYAANHLLRLNAREGTFPTDAHGHRALEDNDIAVNRDQLRFGKGWSPRNTYREIDHRWIWRESELFILNHPGGSLSITLDLENGPGVHYKPIELEFELSGQQHKRKLDGRQRIQLEFRELPEGTHTLHCRLHHDDALEALNNAENLVACVYHVALNSGETIPAPSALAKVTQQLKLPLRKLVFEMRKKTLLTNLNAARVHTNGCGDFTLMHRDDWNLLTGYPELEIFSMHLDSLTCYEAVHAGLKEVVLEDPMRIYHIEHGAGWTPEADETLFQSLDRKGLPYLTYDDLLNYYRQMERLKGPIRFNKDKAETWGFADQTLPEQSPVR